MPDLILLIGPPCSGKSTWAKEYLKKNPNTLRFNRDDMRFMLGNKPMLDSVDEYTVTQMIDLGIDLSLESGRNVIVDQTNCKLKYINRFIIRYEDNKSINIRFKVLQENIELLKMRNIERSQETGIPRIPEEIIDMMFNNQVTLLNNNEFKKIIKEHGGYMV